MSEQSGFIKPNFPRRVLLILPFVVFALISLTAGFVASRTNGLAYKTPFFHLFFSDVLQMKVWLVTAALMLGLGQLPTASRMYALVPFPP